MRTATQPRALPGRRSLRLSLIHVAVAGASVTGLEIALFAAEGVAPLWAVAVFAMTGLVYVEVGVLAWWRRSSGRIGALLVGCGAALLLAAAGNATLPVLAVAGTLAAELPIGVILHLLLAFPSGRLPDRWSRVLAVAGYVVTVGLQAPLSLFGSTPGVPAALIVADRPDVVAFVHVVDDAAGFVLIVFAALNLLRRLRAADTAQRRVLAAVSGYGVFTILFLTLSAILARTAGLDPIALFVAQVSVVLGLPFAFLAGVLRGGFARTADLEELGAWLGTTDGARPSLQAVLSSTLGDPSLELLFWLPNDARYVRPTGDPVRLPALGSSRAVMDIEVAGDRVGAIVHDAVSVPDAELVRAAGRVVALAVERERLTAELLAGRAALRESRTRIVESGDRERRRITRDLHDGLQAQLVVVALQAGRLAAHRAVDPAVAAAAGELRAGVETAIGQLRGLAHGILPALLVERGLYAATEELLDQVPIPSTLERPTGDAPLPAAVESAGYFTVAEALTNAVKHADARTLFVRIARVGDLLTIEVIDDGVGGASPDRGSGLRGIIDRVEALGGQLRMRTAPGQGTTLVVELPCGL